MGLKGNNQNDKTTATTVATNTTEKKITSTIKNFSAKAEKEFLNNCPYEDIAEFIAICKASQRNLKEALIDWANKNKKVFYSQDGFLLIEGDEELPVLVTAHMDTVHKELVNNYHIFESEGKTYITSPEGIGGDDRCGIYMICELVSRGYNPWILFCEDEEVGGVGSNKFVASDYVNLIKDLKFFIEFDRANAYDAVYYDCGNKNFQKWIEKFGFKKAYGSFSDISHLSPAADTASVNLSCGYYKAHTTDEYVVWDEMLETIDKVEVLFQEVESNSDMEKYAYEEDTYEYSRYGNYGGYGTYGGYGLYGRYGIYDDFDDGYYADSVSKKKKARKGYSLKEDIPTSYKAYFLYTDDEGYEEYETEVTGDSKMSCIGKFLMENDVKWSQVLDYYFDYEF